MYVLDGFKHFVFDASSNQFKVIRDFWNEQKLISTAASTGPIFVKQRKSIMTVLSDPISVIEFKDNKWTDLKVENCQDLFASKTISTTTGDFIIFVGGWHEEINNYQDHRLIFFYDVKNNKLIKSDIEAPEEEFTGLTLTRNKDYEDVLTFGFIRKCYKMTNYSDLQALPFYLIKFIGKWVCYETIHLIARERHWTIGVDEIIMKSS